MLQPIFETNLQKYGIEGPEGGPVTQMSCVHSVLVLPIFDTPDKKEAVAALEFVQTAREMAYQPIVKAISRVLEVSQRCHFPAISVLLFSTPTLILAIAGLLSIHQRGFNRS